MFFDIGKRLLDIIGALVGIIIFSPLMLGSAVYIKVVSPDGPILADMKKRVGKNGKEFRFLKFRSMVMGAQDILQNDPELYKKYQENGYKLDPDPRLIKGGKFLRKSSIDEMPQFFNVLKGDMSIVGPRAYFRFELEEQEKRFPHTKNDIKDALTTKPGITGVWQVSGRSSVDFPERIKMDADYAKKRSLLYDISIILKTPLAVLTGKGAV